MHFLLQVLHLFQEYVKTYMIFPSNVWGIATGDLFTKGISRKQSFQIPTLIRASLNRTSGPKEHAGMIGRGLNKWGNVEIHECKAFDLH